MSHTAKAIVIRCMDYRFVSSLRDCLLGFGLKDQYDLVSVAGAAKNMVDPENTADPEFVLRQIEISKRLHHITEVIIINHLDCGAYGGNFESPEAERTRHETDLKKAKEMIAARFPDLQVKTMLAGLVPSHTATVEHIDIS